MKTAISYLVFAFTVVFSLPLAAAEPAWTIDKAHSKVGFTVSHMGLSSVDGRFSNYDGTVTADGEGRVSAVSAVVQVSSINTGNDDRDIHLRSADLFNAPKYPTITMNTETVKWSGNSLSGKATLTIMGKALTVRYNGKLTGKKVVTENGKQMVRAGYVVTTKVNRDQFGLNFGGASEAFGLVGKTVDITINVEIVRPQ